MSFDVAKKDLLSKLNCGVDFSPKGSIDLPVLELVNFINTLSDYVTTSSCSGRISVYLNENQTKGIRWILVKHRTVHRSEIVAAIHQVESGNNSLVVLKCEAFILHVSCRDVESGRMLHQLAMGCGFRESGISIGQKKVIVAVRTTAFNLELPLARGANLLVDDMYIDLITEEANSRLRSNFARADKFLMEMKRLFQFPTLTVTQCSAAGEGSVRRWGHACVPYSTDATVVADTSSRMLVGGYGVEMSTAQNVASKSSSEKCVRGLSTVLNSANGASTTVLQVDGSMHGAAILLSLDHEGSAYHFTLLSGGRHSPHVALPCIASITAQGTDHAALTVQHSEVVEQCHGHASLPVPRWGHTVTPISANSYLLYGGRNTDSVMGDAHILSVAIENIAHVGDGMSTVKLLCSWRSVALTSTSSVLPPPRFFHAVAAIEDVYVDEHSRSYVLVHGGLTCLYDPCSSAEAFMVNPWTGAVQYLSNAPLNSVTGSKSDGVDNVNDTVAADKKQLGSGGPRFVSRFGHTLTKIGAKSLLLLGGSSFGATDDIDSEQYVGDSVVSGNATVVLDLSMDSEARYVVQYRRVAVRSAVDDISVHDALPCQECRSHHTAHFDSSARALHVDGGGLMVLAFGSHLCRSMVLQVFADSGESSTIGKTTHDKANAVSAKHRSDNSATPSVSNRKTSDVEAVSATLLARSSAVKRVKVLLETHKLINKTRSISKCDTDAQLQNVEALDLHSLTAVPSDSALSVVMDEQSAGQAWMAVPVADEFMQLMRSRNLTEPLLTQLQEALQSGRGVSWLITADSTANRISKRVLSNTFQRANDYLMEVVHRHALPAQLPNKYETVGDFLMIPSDALCGDAWQQFLAADEHRTEQFWTDLAAIFNLRKVARKSIIDSGVLRESQVSLLLPVVGQPAETGPGTTAWNSVVENGIRYSWDLSRVMFCSGNITEKMRMARVPAKGETIVDFYCGVGYYSIPLLVHAGAACVIALEWNANSVLALRENMRSNKVSPERYTILEGDNRVTSATVVDVADRVLLGLLPSSVPGWPLAARALKPTGGVIHVHENVTDKLIDSWVTETCGEFERLLAAQGKAHLAVSKVHLEKVKSYAPHIYHVVLDLRCAPRDK